ncbi:hypothetical protein V6Z12_A04G062000 [Gossypium hirsutum]
MSLPTMGYEFCESSLANSVGTRVVDNVLVEKKGELVRARTRLRHETDFAERQLLHIEDDVRDLQTKAVEILSNVETLEMEIQQNKRCLNWCPNWSWRYRLSKKAMKKTLDISELLEKINKFRQPGRVGYRAPNTLPTIEFLCSKEFVVSESSKIAFHQIIEALQDDNISMIGLWGMGGVGKTTLAREVGNQAEKLNLFNKVVIATVSQKPNFEAIQDQIAQYIDFDMKNERGRRSVQDLWLRLKNEQRILVILDDVWTYINLKEKIGIPTGEDHKGCKVLLTTRRQQVCLATDCQTVVQLGCLDGDEAWTLFAMKASLNGSVDDAIRKVATKIIRKCQGLPIAIVPLGSALKGKSCHEWKTAYRRLKDRRLTEIEDVNEENAYLCLEASFDYLKGMETKTCFLLCSLYPEDHEIYVEDLVRYAWGLELYKGINSIEKVRSEVLASIEILKNSCLLLDCEERHVKMHDVRREEFSFASVGTLPMDESFKHFMAIAFNTDQLGELPKGSVFPNLKFLLLRGTGKDRMETSSEFFEGMKALKACALDHQLISRVPFQFQINLKTLNLRYSRFSDISMIGKLKTLEIFSLSESRISELPNEIGDLENLRLLELSNCKELRRIPYRLIQRLSNLEELYFHGCWSMKWATENTTENECYSSLSELNLLPKLGVLSLDLDPQHLPDGFVFPKLWKFDVWIRSNWWTSFKPCPISRSLRIIDIKSIDACKQLFEDVESLDLKTVQGYPNLIPSLELEFSKLTSLGLDSCDGMKCLIDASKLQELSVDDCPRLTPLIISAKIQNLNCLFPITVAHGSFPKHLNASNLQTLEIRNCSQLEEIIQDPQVSNIGLQCLREIKVENCNNLRYLFPMSIANSLQGLRTLQISRCFGLEEIIKAKEAANLTSLASLSHGHILKSLTNLEIYDCLQLEDTFPISMAQGLPLLNEVVLENLPQFKGRGGNEVVLTLSSLQKLKVLFDSIYNLSSLKFLSLMELTELQVIWNGPIQAVNFQNLTELNVGNCRSLRYIFSPTIAQYLPRLSELHISDCEDLEQIIDKDQTSSQHHLQPICFPSLAVVSIRDCENLKYLFPITSAHGYHFVFPSLEYLDVKGCPNLTTSFSVDSEQSVHAETQVHFSPKLSNEL